MANEDPEYVRLPDRLLGGCFVDLATGWGISGLDVKPFPNEDDEPEEVVVVRQALRDQKLEFATQAQFDQVQQAHERVGNLAAASVPREGDLGRQVPWNEAAISKLSAKINRQLVAKRVNGDDTSDESVGYEGLSRAELVAEVRRRNNSRDEENRLADTGKKEDLVTRLEEDDRARV